MARLRGAIRRAAESGRLLHLATYPTLQLAARLPALLDAVQGLLAGRRAQGPTIDNEHAPLRHHPTLAEYAVARLSGRAR